MTDDDLRHQLLDALTRQGGSAGNKTLRETLGWDEGTYDRVVAQLKALGKVVPGRGRGGSLSLPGFDGAEPHEPPPIATAEETERFVAVLRTLGGNAGNVTLQERLGWDKDTYFRVQKVLVQRGQISTGRGRGGSVSLERPQQTPGLFDPPNEDLAPLTPNAPTTAALDNVSEAETPILGRMTTSNGTEAPTRTRGRASRAEKATPARSMEQDLWLSADQLRAHMDAAEYKHVVLGLIFLKYLSDRFNEHKAKLEQTPGALPEDKDEYLADNVFWVPQESRWDGIQGNSRQPDIGNRIDAAMIAIERENPRLKGVLTKDYGRPSLNKTVLGGVVDLISNIQLAGENRDLLGRVYEYFLGKFAAAEGKLGGQFYTPSCIVRLLVEMIEPLKGRVYDPCCGSGGMFVSSERFVEAHGGRLNDISIYGQESNPTTWRLAAMNLAIRGIEADLGKTYADSFHDDQHKDLKADYILANPPFNVSEWGGDRLKDDARWKYGIPSEGNANYAWLQHMIHHLGPQGMAGIVLANGSMSSNQSNEGIIRQKMVEADLVDCMVALPGQLFFTTQIPACLWFLTRSKTKVDQRPRQGETLFIDARKLGTLTDRVHRELTDEDIKKIADTYHAWRGTSPGKYEDVPGFCKAVKREEIEKHGFVLTPGRYVGAEAQEDDGEPFDEKMKRLVATLESQFAESKRLEEMIRANLRGLGYGG